MSNQNFRNCYFVYGISVESEIPLPELPGTDLAPSVNVKVGQIDKEAVKAQFKASEIFDRPGFTVYAGEKTVFIDWYDFCYGLIEDGTRATVEVHPGIDIEDVASLVTGPILSIALHQQKKLVLHASAVSIDGVCLVFMGDKGYGKSTLAAHLQARGHRLISDDVVPIRFVDDTPLTSPGYPQIKIFPDSVESIGVSPDSLPQVNKYITKRYYECQQNFSTEPVRIGQIYVLGMDDDLKIEKKSFTDAFVNVLTNTYMFRYLEATHSSQIHFAQCQRLLNMVPVSDLKRPHDFSYISKICDRLEEQARLAA